MVRTSSTLSSEPSRHPGLAAASLHQRGGRAIDDQLTLIWTEAKAHLQGRVNDPTFRLWFERTVPLEFDGNTFVLGVPNDFARDWVQECQAGQPSFKAMRRRGAEHPIEEVGARLRAMMPWIAKNKLVDKTKN